MARGTEETREALRARILDAADEVIAGQGLEQLGMRSLAERAGCSVGMLYKVFADGDDIVLRVNARTLQAIGGAMRQEADGVDERVAALRAMALAYLGYAAAHRRRWDALFVHRMAGGAPVPAWFTEERERVFGILLRHAAPGWGAGAAREWAHTLFSAVHGTVLLGLGEKLGSLSAQGLQARVVAVVDALQGGLPGFGDGGAMGGAEGPG